MLNYQNKAFLLLASSVLCICIAQPVLAVTKPVTKPTVKLKPQKITSRLALAKLLMAHHTNRYSRYLMLSPTDDSVAATDNGSTTVSHSDTNIQVQGVDEADTVKVGDDGYIYQIHNNQIRIIKGFPVSALNQDATIKFPDSNFYPTGLYVQKGKLVVLGTSWQTLAQPKTNSKMVLDWGFWNQYAQTRTLIYDVSNHFKPKQVRDLAIDGNYLDSRRVGDNLYFVARTYPRYYMYGDTANSSMMTLANMLPAISDKKAGKTTKKLLSLNDLAYFPEFVEPDYVIAASVNLEHPEKNLITKAYLGAGEMVYASMKNLYLSASKYNFGSNTDTNSSADIMTTQIFKFGIQNGAIDFAAAGEVAGTALNQFSMDESGDYFRIATTTQNWSSATNESHNSLFVLNKDMKTVGQLKNLAKGEQIYSARFLGDRCYLVTFRLVDPLFAIDLSKPEKPTVMGELKIPGYSNYLHPYDETHLIGFGKNAAVYKSEKADSDQSWAGGSAFYQGLKVALFDVADMKHPKELHSATLGDRGTHSPLLWNHKALYWDVKQHVFGFPVELYQLPQGFNAKQPWQYGLPTYQGAYIYEVTPEKGFKLKAKLSQIPADVKPHHEKGDGYEYAYWGEDATNLFVDRLLRIDSNLYTLSNNQISVYDLVNYQEQTTLVLR